MPKGKRPQKKARIDFIVELMVSNRWVTGMTGSLLAETWALSKNVLERDAAEASRQIQVLLDPDERERRKALWLANIAAARSKADRLGRMESVKGLLELEGKAMGFFEPEKVELSGNLGDLLTLGLESEKPGDGGGEEPPEPVAG